MNYFQTIFASYGYYIIAENILQYLDFQTLLNLRESLKQNGRLNYLDWSAKIWLKQRKFRIRNSTIVTDGYQYACQLRNSAFITHRITTETQPDFRRFIGMKSINQQQELVHKAWQEAIPLVHNHPNHLLTITRLLRKTDLYASTLGCPQENCPYKGGGKSPSKIGYTPIHLAAIFGEVDFIKFLKSNASKIWIQAQIDLTYGYNNRYTYLANAPFYPTPMHFAAFYGHLEVIKALEQFTWNYNRNDCLGLNILDVAEIGGNTDIARYLLGRGICLRGTQSWTLTDFATIEDKLHLFHHFYSPGLLLRKPGEIQGDLPAPPEIRKFDDDGHWEIDYTTLCQNRPLLNPAEKLNTALVLNWVNRGRGCNSLPKSLGSIEIDKHLFQIMPIHNKGLGWQAMATIGPGQLLLREKAYDFHLEPATPFELYKYVDMHYWIYIFSTMKTEEQENFLNLHNLFATKKRRQKLGHLAKSLYSGAFLDFAGPNAPPRHFMKHLKGNPDQIFLIWQIVYSNQIHDGFIGLRISRLNHSCTPNTVIIVNEKDRTMEARTLRQVHRNEELTIDYLAFNPMRNYNYRTDYFKDLGFQCSCCKCRAEIYQGNNTKVGDYAKFDKKFCEYFNLMISFKTQRWQEQTVTDQKVKIESALQLLQKLHGHSKNKGMSSLYLFYIVKKSLYLIRIGSNLARCTEEFARVKSYQDRSSILHALAKKYYTQLYGSLDGYPTNDVHTLDLLTPQVASNFYHRFWFK